MFKAKHYLYNYLQKNLSFILTNEVKNFLLKYSLLYKLTLFCSDSTLKFINDSLYNSELCKNKS